MILLHIAHSDVNSYYCTLSVESKTSHLILVIALSWNQGSVPVILESSTCPHDFRARQRVFGPDVLEVPAEHIGDFMYFVQIHFHFIIVVEDSSTCSLVLAV